MVNLGALPLSNLSALSEQASLVLSLIRNGDAWLKWAIDIKTDRYDFQDENALLSAVQAGLHTSSLILLPKAKLLVGVTKLLSMNVGAIKTLIANEEAPPSVISQDLQNVLVANDLKSQQTLAVTQNFLQNAGVANAPMFQAMTLGDQIAICDLVRLSENLASMKLELQHDAAAFAVSLGTNPLEFVDLYKIYYQVALRRNIVDANTKTRDEQALNAWVTIAPLVLPWLNCPSFGRMLSPEALFRSIRGWMGPGKVLGFTRLTSAVFQVVANSVYASQTGADARNIVDTYAKESQAFIMANAPSTALVSQDGLACSYLAQTDSLETRLQSTGAGLTTITSFCARRKVPGKSPQPLTTAKLPVSLMPMAVQTGS